MSCFLLFGCRPCCFSGGCGVIPDTSGRTPAEPYPGRARLKRVNRPVPELCTCTTLCGSDHKIVKRTIHLPHYIQTNLKHEPERQNPQHEDDIRASHDDVHRPNLALGGPN